MSRQHRQHQQQQNQQQQQDGVVETEEEILVHAFRESQAARARMVSQLAAAQQLQSRNTELTKQLMALTRTVSLMRERESMLLSEISELKDELAMRTTADSDAELTQLRLENAALKTQCIFLSDEARTNVSLVTQSARRSSELNKMLRAEAIAAAPAATNTAAGDEDQNEGEQQEL